MRSLAWILVVFVACDWTYNPPRTTGGDDDAPIESCWSGSDAPCPQGQTSCSIHEANGLTSTCSCVTTSSQPWWACSDCPFFEGSGAVACSQPGLGCGIVTWEHDCDCSCGSDGWWHCIAGTIGSMCPNPPPPDAGTGM